MCIALRTLAVNSIFNSNYTEQTSDSCIASYKIFDDKEMDSVVATVMILIMRWKTDHELDCGVTKIVMLEFGWLMLNF